MIDLADDSRLAGGQQHDVAIQRAYDFADALRAGEARVFRQMHGFAVRGNRDFRPQPGVHLRELRAARMTGDVNELGAVGDDLDALRDEAVDDFADRLFIARNGARGEDDDIARRQSGGRMFVLGDARQGGARLALASRRQSQNLCPRNAIEMILADESREAIEIAAFARHRDDALHRAADHHDLLAVGDPRLGGGAKTRDIGGESRDDDAAGGLPDEFGKVRRDIGLRGALALAKHVGRIADQRQDALVAEGAKTRFVGRPADQRRRIDLPVAGVDDQPGRGADRQGAAFGDRMGDGDEFHVERTHRHMRALRHDLDGNLWRARLAQAARLQQAGGEARRKDPDA